MNKTRCIVISALVGLTLCCCSHSAKESYKDKDINIIRKMEKKEGEEKSTPVIDKTISIRFYDSTPNVPYIDVSSYFKEFFNTTLKKEKNNNSYKYSLEGGEYIEFDSQKDLFSSYCLRAFNDHPDFKTSTSKTFLKTEESNHTTPSINTISLKNYEIDIHDNGKEAYVPFSFLSKFTGGYSSYNAQYNGKDIYVIDGHGLLTDELRDVKYYADSYYEVANDFTTDRPADLAKYTYNELCFVFDNFRGYTSQLVFGDNNLLSLGLNGLIDHYYPKIKEYILSPKKDMYYLGIYYLFLGLFDGGHTAITNTSDGYVESISKIQSIGVIYPKMSREYATRMVAKMNDGTTFKQTKAQIFGIEDYDNHPNYYAYNAETKTAFVGFDSFVVDYDGWDNYYKDKDPNKIPVETDSYAFVRSKFYQAKKDGAENLVLDLSTNGGGNSDALNGIVGLFSKGKSSVHANDTFNKYRDVENFSVDINLDGNYDELDAQETEQFDFNLGVLTSKLSFSCGNLLPSVLKGYGYKILGEQSGGGSCAVIQESTADGIPYAHSSYHCLSDAAGNNIDAGVPVDFPIERQMNGNEADVSNFYNFESIANYLKDAYREIE